MSIVSKILELKAPSNSELGYFYEDGEVSAFKEGYSEGKVDSVGVVKKYDELIAKLFDALENRHADDLVDKLKEEYGIE